MEQPSRRQFLGTAAALAGVLALEGASVSADTLKAKRPNVLFLMTDQQRFDTIAALGNPHIHTPNYDRLVRRGLAFTRAYSPCPVCVPARYTIRTGCLPPTTGIYANGVPNLAPGQAARMEERCGPYLARAMGRAGYRTFGIGKFHTWPVREDVGYETQLYSEEMYGSPEERARDDFAAFIAREHPAFDWIEALMGERTEMYYMPQMSALPPELTVEGWAADRAVEQVRKPDPRPWFGFVSFVGPHPPFAPPLPFNRMYDPDRMPSPVRGRRSAELMDEQVRWMNHAIWAEDIADPHARVLKARYYGEISYIDQCIGRILDAVEAVPDPDNTLICMFSDHGDHLGDHFSWQKESFFDGSCRVPFLVSWPARLPRDVRRDELVTLADLFGIATSAAGAADLREGVDVLGGVTDGAPHRDHVMGMYGVPGTDAFKVMVRDDRWKYIWMANGRREQLFDVESDPHELRNRAGDAPREAARLRDHAVHVLATPNAGRALEGGALKGFRYRRWKDQRIYQFDTSRGVRGFPARPGDALAR